MFRPILIFVVAVVALVSPPPFARADTTAPKKVLFFSKSAGFEHTVITRRGGPSFAEQRLADLGPKHGIEFTFSKDGSLFTPEYLAQFDACIFFTTGDLLVAGKDRHPPMTPEGKAALLAAIENGKGFVGVHSATDTFITGETAAMEGKLPKNWRYQNHGDNADPYIRMIGAQFIVHGAQQSATSRVVDPKFPGFENKGQSFDLHEEWYSLSSIAPDLHVLLVQETAAMLGSAYQRPPYPSTWARLHGKGRVFYTALGHREDVWLNPLFQEILMGGVAWAARKVDADVTPNIAAVTPGYAELPPAPRPAPPPAPAPADAPKP